MGGRKWLPVHEQFALNKDLKYAQQISSFLNYDYLTRVLLTRRSQFKTNLVSLLTSPTDPGVDGVAKLLIDSFRSLFQTIYFNYNPFRQPAEELLSIRGSCDMSNEEAVGEAVELFILNWPLLTDAMRNFVPIKSTAIHDDIYDYFANTTFDRDLESFKVLIANKLEARHGEPVEVASCSALAQELFDIHEDYLKRSSLSRDFNRV